MSRAANAGETQIEECLSSQANRVGAVEGEVFIDLRFRNCVVDATGAAKAQDIPIVVEHHLGSLHIRHANHGLAVFVALLDAVLRDEEAASHPVGMECTAAELELSGDLKIVAFKRSGDFLQIEVVQSSDPEAGRLILGFKEDPMTLKKWRIIDAQGLITEVELFYLKTDVAHASGMFAYKNPKPKKLND